jgi:uncharacterized surface protein with fasciclin (FAS1) repeats
MHSRSRHGRTAGALWLLIAWAAVSGNGVAAACTQAQFVSAVANVSDLQTSSSLLSGALATIGARSNSTVFLPTDSAWTKFRAANGVSAPDANRTIAILLYNSIITLGEASKTTLVKSSPIETSAAALLATVANKSAYLPLAFANDSSVVQATDVAGNVVNLTASYMLCNTQVYTTSGVLLPAASYSAIPETYPADVATLVTLASEPNAPATSASLSPAPVPATSPTSSASGGGASTSPAVASTPSPMVATAAAPAPAPSAALPAAPRRWLLVLGGGLLTAVISTAV